MQIMAIKIQTEYIIKMFFEITIFHNRKKTDPLGSKPVSMQYP
jgi:hypothetical protein